MKTYKQYVNEEVMPFAQTDKGFVGIESEAVRDNINDLLDGVTNKGFVTPYNALERISKVLAYAHIHLPKYSFSEGDHGATAFQVNQFGLKAGMTNAGEFVKNVPVKYFVYFEYHKGDNGLYDVFATICEKEELDELIDDYENESDNNFDNRYVDELNKLDHDYETNAEEHAGYLEENRIRTDPPNPQQQIIPEFAADAAKRATKRAKEKKNLAENYHASYSDAIKTALTAAEKRGYTVDSDDYHDKVASGPRKPSEGKTVSHTIKLTKGGKPSKKSLAIQVYNRGGDKTPYELNHYISEGMNGFTDYGGHGDYGYTNEFGSTKRYGKAVHNKTGKVVANITQEYNKKTGKVGDLMHDEPNAQDRDPDVSFPSDEKDHYSVLSHIADYSGHNVKDLHVVKYKPKVKAKLKEETQLDEVSKKLAKSYAKAAKKAKDDTSAEMSDNRQRMYMPGYDSDKVEKQQKSLKRDYMNRSSGIERAKKILAKEETQIDEKLSAEIKRKIRRRLGPNTPENRQRQNSDSARAEIRLAKRGGKDKDLNEGNRKNKKMKNIAIANIGNKEMKKTGAFHGEDPKRVGRATLTKDLNEVSKGLAIRAAADANDPIYSHPKGDALMAHVKRKFGDKAAKHAQDKADVGYWGRDTYDTGDSLQGGLRNYLEKKLTKSGKIPKNTQTAMKGKTASRKITGPKSKLPEETQLDELSNELIGKVNSIRFRTGINSKTPTAEKTLRKAVDKVRNRTDVGLPPGRPKSGK